MSQASHKEPVCEWLAFVVSQLPSTLRKRRRPKKCSRWGQASAVTLRQPRDCSRKYGSQSPRLRHLGEKTFYESSVCPVWSRSARLVLVFATLQLLPTASLIVRVFIQVYTCDQEPSVDTVLTSSPRPPPGHGFRRPTPGLTLLDTRCLQSRGPVLVHFSMASPGPTGSMHHLCDADVGHPRN